MARKKNGWEDQELEKLIEEIRENFKAGSPYDVVRANTEKIIKRFIEIYPKAPADIVRHAIEGHLFNHVRMLETVPNSEAQILELMVFDLDEVEQTLNLIDWGIDPSIVEHSASWSCQNHHTSPSLKNLQEYDVVGFKRTYPLNNKSSNIKPGILVFQCPKCSTLFWFHTNINFIKKAQKSPKWPKKEVGK
jgi:hypothetical protein